MRTLLLICLWLYGTILFGQKEPDCQKMLKQAKAFERDNKLSKAVQFYLNALNCNSGLGSEIGPLLKGVFGKIEEQKQQEQVAKKEVEVERDNARREKENAERGRRRAYADDLAYKSTIALRDGDLTAAFRIAEFAYRYVDDDNLSVTNALVQAIYYNEDPAHQPLAWAENTLISHECNINSYHSRIKSVAFSPDGKRLATGSGDNTAKIWDCDSGKEILTLRGHNSQINSVAFSPDGKRLATGSFDNTAKIWDLDSGKDTLTLRGHKSAVLSVAFSPDGKRLATGSMDKTVKIWSLESGKDTMTLSRYPDDNGEISSVAFSPDGKWLATGYWDSTAKIWDLDSSKDTMTLRGHTSEISSVAFSPDGKWLATGSGDYTAKIWDLDSGKDTMTLNGNTCEISCVAFSPDGKRLATGFGDYTAKIWDLNIPPKSGHISREILKLSGHTDVITSVAFSPDGKRLATGSGDYTAKIWDLDNNKDILNLTGHKEEITSLAFSPDGKWLATGSWDSTAKIWDLDSGKDTLTLSGHTSEIRSIAFSPDGKRLATGSWDKTAKIWDLDSGKDTLTLRGHNSLINSIAFSPDGKRLATGSFDNTAKIWDLGSGKDTLTLKGHTDEITSVAFSPDGKRFATGSRDNTAKIWDLDSGKDTLTLKGHTDEITSVAFSPDGKRLATGSRDNTAKIWDLDSGKYTLTLSGHTSEIRSIAFSPDGKRLATGSWDKTAKIWDLDSGKDILTLRGHNSLINSIAFSPDGKRLATVAGDKTAKIWELTLEGWRSSSFGNRPLAGLFLPQLSALNLSGLLDIRPDNEAVLRQSKAPLQLVAFAELYAQNTLRSRDLRQTASDFARSARIYGYALDSGGDSALVKSLGDLYLRWAEDILVSSRPDTALWYMERTCQLCPDKSQCLKIWLDYSERTGKSTGLQRFMASEDTDELLQYGGYCFENEKWAEARQFFEKVEGKKHSARTLQSLFTISEKTDKTFKFERFMATEDPKELDIHASFFTNKAWKSEKSKDKVSEFQNALRLREKQMILDTSAALRIAVADEYGSLSYFQLFLPDGLAVEANSRRALELDPDYIEDYNTILAPALMLQGKDKEAEAEYKKWAPLSYHKDEYFQTYREKFIQVLETMEKQGVLGFDFARVRGWLAE